MTDGGDQAEAERLIDRAFRLHPLSIPYRVLEQGLGLAFVLLVVGAPAFGVVQGTLGSTPTAALGVVIVLGVVGYGVAYYRRFEYELTADTFDIRSGVFARRDREIPLRRIQNVDISQNVVQRALGIAEVRLETAGGSTSEAHLKFVSVARANRLQREISRLSRASDEQSAEPETFETLFEISDRELGLLAVVSTDLRIIPALFLGASVFAPSAAAMFDAEMLLYGYQSVVGAIVGPLVTLAGIVLIGLLYGALNATLYYGFTLRGAADELRYERGLLQKYSGTIPLSKIQSLTVEENVLARWLGYASLEIETAGQSGSGAGSQGSTQSAIPIATRGRVLELTNSIEAVGDVTFERPPKRARQRYVVRYAAVVLVLTGLLWGVDAVVGLPFAPWLALGALVLVPPAAHLKWRNRGYAVGENHVLTRNGFWVRQTKIVPYYRVQTVASSATVFQRRRRLGTVTIDTAGARSLVGNDAEAVDVDEGTAARLREAVTASLYTALRRRREEDRRDRRRPNDEHAPGG
ncbi:MULTISPECIES: PH domain-containing protein [Halolamina]|uniref:Putative membrane protein n=1 Tax=Halolamina pelagica TaxID=699431 RepID=A0A1I5TTD8_9EURY|nr:MULTISPECIES: PH domain-containing protein [Halolamina]NHX37793.1 PH domain-containing protein [Halolamina sp. R1-12]SFP86309.1 putative membrane protein [Halolamina pelagica]